MCIYHMSVTTAAAAAVLLAVGDWSQLCEHQAWVSLNYSAGCNIMLLCQMTAAAAQWSTTVLYIYMALCCVAAERVCFLFHKYITRLVSLDALQRSSQKIGAKKQKSSKRRNQKSNNKKMYFV